MNSHCNQQASFVCCASKIQTNSQKALMAETTGYDYDIFISYAHNDNYVLSGDKGWVTQFHELLSNWLKRQRGLKDLKIWFDESNLDGNTRVDDEIKSSIEKSALFFVIHSKNYDRSKYCNQELDWFLDHNQRNVNGTRIGNESRLFNIQIQNLHFEQWPKKLSGTSGFALHDAKESKDEGYPTSSQSNRKLFDEQIRKVVEAAEKTIRALKSQAPQHKKMPKESDSVLPKLFIANVSDSLKAFRNQIISEVEHRATILDSLPPPFTFDEHTKQLNITLNQSSLSIHLLDQFSGTQIVGASDGSTFPRVQADTVRSRDQHSLIWVPENLELKDIEEQDQAEWLNDLEKGQRQSNGFQFVRSSRTAFTNQVNQVLDGLIKQQSSEKTHSRFLIDTHQKDQRHAYSLADTLACRDIDVDFNKESTDPVKSLENFENAVREVEHLIIMFGQVAPQWVGGRIFTAVKVVAEQLQNSNPNLEAIWVYMLPNNSGKKSLPKIPPLFKLTCLDNSANDKIDEKVVETLLTSQGGL